MTVHHKICISLCSMPMTVHHKVCITLQHAHASWKTCKVIYVVQIGKLIFVCYVCLLDYISSLYKPYPLYIYFLLVKIIQNFTPLMTKDIGYFKYKSVSYIYLSIWEIGGCFFFNFLVILSWKKYIWCLWDLMDITCLRPLERYCYIKFPWDYFACT